MRAAQGRRGLCATCLLLVSVLGQGATPGGAAALSNNEARLSVFLADEWQYELEHHPEMATYVGDERYNDRLSDFSAAEYARENAHDEAQLRTLETMPTAGLTEQEQISWEMMLRQLQLSIDGYRLKTWEMPVSQMAGIHLDFPAMYAQAPLRTAQDLRNYIARLDAMPRAFDQETEVLRLGMRDHLIEPRYLLEKVVTEVSEIANGTPQTSPFAQPLAHLSPEIPAVEQAAIRKDLLAAVAEDVLLLTGFNRGRETRAGEREPLQADGAPAAECGGDCLSRGFAGASPAVLLR